METRICLRINDCSHEIIRNEDQRICYNRTAIRTKFNHIYRGSFYKGNEKLDDYKLFHVYYKDEDIMAIEFFKPCILCFGDFTMIGRKLEECYCYFVDKDPNLLCEKDIGFISKKYQIGVFAPSGIIESVLVGSKDYY